MLTIDAEEFVHVPAIGENSGDNTFDSALVVSDRDGSVLERSEFLMDDLTAQAAAIAALENSLLVLTETGGTITTDGTEQNLYVNNAPAGVYDPKIICVDFANQTATETIVIREYYRIKSGGNFIQEDEEIFIGVRTLNLKIIELTPNRFGVKVTIQRTAGGAKDYDYEAVYKI